MPTYKDIDKGTYFCKFYYVDWTGQRRQKLKRGFARQRDAKDWEKNFLEKQQSGPDMTFKILVELYLEDISPRIKKTTYTMKKRTIDKWILPYFSDTTLDKLTSASVRKWQNMLMQQKTAQDKPFSPTYLHAINKQLNAILNFACIYYNLRINPCKQAGNIGCKKAGKMEFWTKDQYSLFSESVKDHYSAIAFETLYYTGLRIGELLGITLKDIDFEKATIDINKTVYEDGTISTPKTNNSIRTVTIPQFLVDDLKNYCTHIYDLRKNDRIFPYSKRVLFLAMKKYSALAGVPRIRLHDLRHSHVSLLIDMGFQSILIAERIGDTVDMVNETYGHLYPNRHSEVATELNKLVSK